MTKHSTSNLLLAAALSLPVFARAQVVEVGIHCRAFSGSLTAAQAKAAIVAAENEADANTRRLTQLPFEIVGLSVAMPYGAEGPEICFGDGNAPDALAALERKAAYWNAVCDALVADRTGVEGGTVEDAVAAARDSVRRDREVRACEAAAADAKDDAAMLRKLMKSPPVREPNENILARKTKLFKQFAALKTAP